MNIYGVLGYNSYSSLANGLSISENEMNTIDDGVSENLVCTVKLYNTLNLMGYIPIVGCFTAKTRINFLKPEEPLSYKIYEYARSLFEILGCGLLFLPIDFSVSFYKHFFAGGPIYNAPEVNVSYFDIIKKTLHLS
jgi:hypothetical protein